MNVMDAFDEVKDYFSPRIISEVEDMFVKIARIKGEDIPWHSHDNEDELFLILEGQMYMHIEGSSSFLMQKGDMYVVPKGVRHRVFSEHECKIMLIEKMTTSHTGDEKSIVTKSIQDQQY